MGIINIDDWLFRNALMYQCNNDCVHCTEENCEDRLVEYGENMNENIRQID